jgi:hypothetical protein
MVVVEIVCPYSSSGDADDKYDAGSLADDAGEDWPNFEPGAVRPA